MIITTTIHMTELNRDREITIYAPDDYATSGRRYPVMYINDGQNAFFDEQAFGGVSWGFLGHKADLIMVAIPCNFGPYMRESEYGVWQTDRHITILETGRPEPGLGGEGDAYVRFIKDELKPFIDREFPTDSDDTAIVGSSAGGNISFYAALRYPEVFSKCAALSCAFWYYPEQYVKLVEGANLEPLQILYMDRGTNEGNGNDFVTNLYNYDMALVHDALMTKEHSDHIDFRIYEGAQHNEGAWRQRVPVFMDLFYK
ncbi:MAG: alpha/beta hydrolase [Eubacterium sp.]|nr:alpha/beta hydrolase [Candidatus Colimonas fimequi]